MITDRQAIDAERAYQAHGKKVKDAAEVLKLELKEFKARRKAFKDRKLELPRQIILVDERCTRVRHRRVSEKEKHDYFQTYGMVYEGPDLIPVHDKRGRKIIDMTGQQVVLEAGRGLERAVARAKRWMKNNPAGTNKRMPRHIEMGARAMEEMSRGAA